MAWFYGLFFPELLPTKPILALVGPAGSGKSFAARRMGLLVFGRAFNVTPLASSEKDFDAVITTDRLVVLDNLDTRRASWLPNKLATAATGGMVKMRALYRNNVLLDYPMVSSLALTARTPEEVRREDLVDRMVLLRLDRLPENIPESDLIAAVLERRRDCLRVLVGHLQLIVDALYAQRGSYRGAFRMADFGRFVNVVRGAVLASGAEAETILARLGHAQGTFVREDDLLYELLGEWLERPGNAGRPVRARDLLEELKDLAWGSSLPPEFRDPTAFGKHLKANANTLRARFRMDARPGQSGTLRYTFLGGDGGDGWVPSPSPYRRTSVP